MGVIDQRSGTIERTTPEDDALPGAIVALERALGASLANDSVWAGRVAAALRPEVLAALKRHASATEAPDGSLTEYRAKMPQAARQIDRLCDEHLALFDEGEELVGTMDKLAAGGHASADGARSRLLLLLGQLRSHVFCEMNLAYEAVDRELGVAD